MTEPREVIWADSEERLWTDAEVEASMQEIWSETPVWAQERIDGRVEEILGLGQHDRMIFRHPDGDTSPMLEVTQIARWRAESLRAAEVPMPEV